MWKYEKEVIVLKQNSDGFNVEGNNSDTDKVRGREFQKENFIVRMGQNDFDLEVYIYGIQFMDFRI